MGPGAGLRGGVGAWPIAAVSAPRTADRQRRPEHMVPPSEFSAPCETDVLFWFGEELKSFQPVQVSCSGWDAGLSNYGQ